MSKKCAKCNETRSVFDSSGVLCATCKAKVDIGDAFSLIFARLDILFERIEALDERIEALERGAPRKSSLTLADDK